MRGSMWGCRLACILLLCLFASYLKASARMALKAFIQQAHPLQTLWRGKQNQTKKNTRCWLASAHHPVYVIFVAGPWAHGPGPMGPGPKGQSAQRAHGPGPIGPWPRANRPKGLPWIPWGDPLGIPWAPKIYFWGPWAPIFFRIYCFFRPLS